MSRHPNAWPWQHKKIDNVWHRRPVNNGHAPWQRLHVEPRTETPTDRNGRRFGDSERCTPSIGTNLWTWK